MMKFKDFYLQYNPAFDNNIKKTGKENKSKIAIFCIILRAVFIC